jgi:hypothetical protein
MKIKHYSAFHILGEPSVIITGMKRFYKNIQIVEQIRLESGEIQKTDKYQGKVFSGI